MLGPQFLRRARRGETTSMTKRRQSEDRYGHMLKSNQHQNSLVVNSLRRAHDTRNERVRLIEQQIPFWFDGFDEVLIGLRSIRSKTKSGELKDLLTRAEEEAYRSVEAILSDDEQTLNDSSRLLMEIEILLMEWHLDPDRVQAWGETTDKTRHAQYGFGKVLERVKRRTKVDNKLEMPERMEYNSHSMTLHPYPGEPIKLLQSFDWQTSELVAHLGRIFRRTFEAVRTAGSPLGMPNDDIHFPGEAWEQLYRVFIGGRDQYLAVMLASRGLRMLPRKPIPKGTSRVVPISSADGVGASFFQQNHPMAPIRPLGGVPSTSCAPPLLPSSAPAPTSASTK